MTDEDDKNDKTYRIRRFFKDGDPTETVATGLSWAEAREHCSGSESSSKTCTSIEGQRRTQARGQWFDGFDEE